MKVVRRLVAIVVAISAIAAVLVALAANTQWAEVAVPAAPWAARPRLVTLEVQVWALLVGSFVVGAVCGALVARPRRRRPLPEGL